MFSRRGKVSDTCDWKLYALSLAFGFGYQFRIFAPSALNRLDGMMFPGNGVLLFAGSMIVTSRPVPSCVLEKSPVLSASDGTVTLRSELGDSCSCHSIPAKK